MSSPLPPPTLSSVSGFAAIQSTKHFIIIRVKLAAKFRYGGEACNDKLHTKFCYLFSWYAIRCN